MEALETAREREVCLGERAAPDVFAPNLREPEPRGRPAHVRRNHRITGALRTAAGLVVATALLAGGLWAFCAGLDAAEQAMPWWARLTVVAGALAIAWQLARARRDSNPTEVTACTTSPTGSTTTTSPAPTARALTAPTRARWP